MPALMTYSGSIGGAHGGSPALFRLVERLADRFADLFLDGLFTLEFDLMQEPSDCLPELLLHACVAGTRRAAAETRGKASLKGVLDRLGGLCDRNVALGILAAPPS